GKARAGRGDDPGREGRGVEAVVADGDEIGVQRGGLGFGGGAATRHAQDVGAVRQRGVGRQRRLAGAGADDGGGEDGRGGQQAKRGRQIVAVGQAGHQGADGLDGGEGQQ